MSLPSRHFVVHNGCFLSSETATNGLITCTLLTLFIASVGTEKKRGDMHENPKVLSQNKTSTTQVSRLQSFVNHNFYEGILQIVKYTFS